MKNNKYNILFTYTTTSGYAPRGLKKHLRTFSFKFIKRIFLPGEISLGWVEVTYPLIVINLFWTHKKLFVETCYSGY